MGLSCYGFEIKQISEFQKWSHECSSCHSSTPVPRRLRRSLLSSFSLVTRDPSSNIILMSNLITWLETMMKIKKRLHPCAFFKKIYSTQSTWTETQALLCWTVLTFSFLFHSPFCFFFFLGLYTRSIIRVSYDSWWTQADAGTNFFISSWSKECMSINWADHSWSDSRWWYCHAWQVSWCSSRSWLRL